MNTTGFAEGLSWCGFALAVCLLSGGVIGLIFKAFEKACKLRQERWDRRGARR